MTKEEREIEVLRSALFKLAADLDAKEYCITEQRECPRVSESCTLCITKYYLTIAELEQRTKERLAGRRHK